MVDWNRKFKAEYDYARGWLGRADRFEESWQPLVAKLYKLMTTDGFDAGQASSLTQLRRRLADAGKKVIGHNKATEAYGILKAVGAWTDNAGGLINDQAKMRAAALKLLRHVYLLNAWGNRKVWVVALPTEILDWPSDDLNARAGTQIAARALLRSQTEHFSSEQRKYLAIATRESLAWCQKTGMILAEAAKTGDKGGAKSVAALKLVKRWFADPSVSIRDLNGYIAKLSKGFKDIGAMLNKGHLVLTDWVPFRNASTEDEIKFLNSEAFTFRSKGEGMDVVYIEKSFFVDHPGNVLKGQKNWTRVVLHELTHLVCGTEDIVNGNARYAWYGIGPHAGYPGSQAVRNADNWAFFGADCAGALTDGERSTALKVI